MENKTTLERFKELYGFREGIKEYIPQPGELLKYVGSSIILLVYEKNEKEEWKISNSIVKLEWMGNYDPMTGTYELTYDTGKPEKDGDKIVYTEGKHNVRVFSQGFSFENPEETGKSLRFIPFSYHYKFVEFQDFYIRLKNEYDSYKTLKIEELEQISKSKDQGGILEPKYICAVIKTEENDILQFRIISLEIKHRNGKNYALTIGNEIGRTYTFMISSSDSEYNFSYGKEYLGKLKIVDLGSEIKKEEN